MKNKSDLTLMVLVVVTAVALVSCGGGRGQEPASVEKYTSFLPYVLTQGDQLRAIHVVDSRAPAEKMSHVVIDQDESAGRDFQLLSTFYSGNYNARNNQVNNYHAYAIVYQKNGSLYKVRIHDVARPVREQISTASNVHRTSTCDYYSAYDYLDDNNARFLYQLKQDCKRVQDPGAWFMVSMSSTKDTAAQMLPSQISAIIQSIHDPQTGQLKSWLVTEKNATTQQLALKRYSIDFKETISLSQEDSSGLLDVRFIGKTHQKDIVLYLAYATGRRGLFVFSTSQNILITLWQETDPNASFFLQRNLMVGGLDPVVNEGCQVKTYAVDHNNVFVVAQSGVQNYELHRIALDGSEGHKILARENKPISGVWKMRNNIAYTLSDYEQINGQKLQLFKELKFVSSDGIYSSQSVVHLTSNNPATLDQVSDDIACVHATADYLYVDLRIKRRAAVQRATYIVPQNGLGYTLTGATGEPFRKVVGYTASSTYDLVSGYNTALVILAEKSDSGATREYLRAYDAISGTPAVDIGEVSLLSDFDQNIFHFYAIGHSFGLFTAYRTAGIEDIFYFNALEPDSILAVTRDDNEKRAIPH